MRGSGSGAIARTARLFIDLTMAILDIPPGIWKSSHNICIASTSEQGWAYIKVYYNEHEQKIRTKGVVQPLGRMHLPLDMKMIHLTA